MARRCWQVNAQKEGHLAFTAQDKSLFALALDKPEKSLTIEATKGWRQGNIESVRLLGSKSKVQ